MRTRGGVGNRQSMTARGIFCAQNQPPSSTRAFQKRSAEFTVLIEEEDRVHSRTPVLLGFA